MKSHLPMLAIACVAVFGFVSSPALAYTTKKQSDGKACEKDGSACDVFCNNGNRAGTMNWNGSVWTDGVKWDKDFDVEAKAICAANGTDCK